MYGGRFMKLKKLDLVIIGVLIAITIASSSAALISTSKKYDSLYVNIEVDGKPYNRLSLNSRNDKIKVQSSYGTNLIEIKDGKVHIEEANCPDKICVKDGFISKPGQILVCLPNKVVLQIVGKDGKGNADDIDF
jgi:hypothetical protein